jgi:hypothetical protein
MSTYCENSYVRIPQELAAEELLKEIRSYLEQVCESERELAAKWHHSRIRHQKGDKWICLYGVAFKSLQEANEIEVLRGLTQTYVDEVIMVSCFGVASFGAYGHFMEGALVRFTAASDDWTESAGAPEPWEGELIVRMGGLHEGTIVELGRKLRLRDIANHELVWDIDIPIRHESL